MTADRDRVRRTIRGTAWVHGSDRLVRGDEKWTVPEQVPLVIGFGLETGVAHLTRERNGDITARAEIDCAPGGIVERLLPNVSGMAVRVRAGTVESVDLLTAVQPMETRRKKENMIDSVTTERNEQSVLIRRFMCDNPYAHQEAQPVEYVCRPVAAVCPDPEGWGRTERGEILCPECAREELAEAFAKARAKEREEDERKRMKDLILRRSEMSLYDKPGMRPRFVARAQHRPTDITVYAESAATGSEALDRVKERIVAEVMKLPGYAKVSKDCAEAGHPLPF